MNNIEDKKDNTEIYRLIIWWILCFILVFLAFKYLGSTIIPLLIVMLGISMTLIIFARSNKDEELGVRSNYILIQFYTKAAFLLLVVISLILLMYAFDYIILSHYR